MTMKLSKRERRMLYLLGCFLLVTLGMYLLIFPAAATRARLSKQLEAFEAQQLARVQAITRMGALDEHVGQLKHEMEQTCARYAPPMFSETLDRQFTSMLRRYNATPVNFVIGETADTPVPHYGDPVADEVPPPVEDDPSLQDYIAAVDPTQKPAPTPPPAKTPQTEDAPVIKTKLLTLEAVMKPADAIGFLAELSADSAIMVQKAEVNAVAAVTNAEGNIIISDNVTLKVEFFHLLAPDLSFVGTAGVPDVSFS